MNQKTGNWRSLLRRSILRAAEGDSTIELGTLANVVMDALPRLELRWSGRPRPAFRTCGAAGFGFGCMVASAAALAGGRTPGALAIAVAASTATFLGWTLLRRRLTGRENLVLLEQVWLGLAMAGIALRLSGQAVLATLDCLAAGLAFFLAAGRAGCLLVGCCHGQPSPFGIRYPRNHARHGFPEHLTWIRLFPVQLAEAAGLGFIGAATFAMVPLTAPGAPLAWFLLAYAILRFCLEELRGDARPFLAGMPVARWMCTAEIAFVVAATTPPGLAIPAIACAAALAVVVGSDFRARRLLRAAHVSELRLLLANAQARGDEARAARAWASGERVTLAVSPAKPGEFPALHVSLCLPDRDEDLALLARLAAAAFPALIVESARHTGSGQVLHFLLARGWTAEGNSGGAAAGDTVFRALYRRLLTQPEWTPQPQARAQGGRANGAAGSPAQTAPSSSSLPAWYWREETSAE